MPNKMFLRIAFIARIVIWAAVILIVLFGKQIVSMHLFPCVWYENFGWLCSTCGASRGVVSLLAGDFSTAVAYNPVVILGLLPVFGILLISDLAVVIWNLFGTKRHLSLFEYCFAVFSSSSFSGKREKTR